MRRSALKSMWMAAGAAALAAAGCGGGQGAGGGLASQGHTAQLGDAVVTYFGQPKPQLGASSGAVSVVGQAGATFGTVTLEPAPNLADTYLVIGRSAPSQYALYELPYSGGAPTLLYHNGQYANSPGISAYGAVAFVSADAGTISTIRPDGTGLTALSFTGLSQVYDPSYAMDGTNRLAFTAVAATTNEICTSPGSGGSPTILQTTSSLGNGLQVGLWGGAWNPAGSKIAFSAGKTLSGTTYYDLFTTPTTSGGTAVDVSPVALQFSANFILPTWSSDGVTIALEYYPLGDSSTVATLNVNTGVFDLLTPSGAIDQTPCFSPDGSKLAFYRSGEGFTAGVYVSDAVGGNPTLLFADPSNFVSSGGISWSPFLPKETVISASGATFYHKAASGFLLSHNGSQFGSVLAFTANTPADAAILAVTPTTPGAQLLFTLSADSITSLGYINNYFDPGTTLSLTSTPSAAVGIDGITGQVDFVAPSLVANPSWVKNADGTLTGKGPFTSVYDGRGKNLAPNGASQVTVDPKSGKLLRWI